jgi:hypothetical protein
MKLFQVTMCEDNNASCIRTVYAIAEAEKEMAAAHAEPEPARLECECDMCHQPPTPPADAEEGDKCDDLDCVGHYVLKGGKKP